MPSASLPVPTRISLPLAKIWFAFLATSLFSGAAFAQSSATGGWDPRPIVLRGGRVIVAPGEELASADVLIVDGQIIAVGPDLKTPPLTESISIAGHVVYAGFMDAASSRWINSETPRPTVEGRSLDSSAQALSGLPPDRHTGLYPQFEVASALRLNDDEVKRARESGVCLVNVAPTGHIASGQTALLQLNDLPAREALLRTGDAVVMKLYDRRTGEYPSTLMGVHSHLRQTFLDARRAALQRDLFMAGAPGVTPPPRDAVWTVFEELATQRRRAVFEVQSSDDIHRALTYANEEHLSCLLWGAREAAPLANLLSERKLDAILTVDPGEEPKADKPSNDGDFPQLPLSEPELQWRQARWKDRVNTAATLHAAKVRLAFSSEGLKSTSDMIPAVRKMIASGLTSDAALAALTTNAAAILGVDQNLGKIAPGFRANLVVMTGPFERETSRVRYAIVGGRKFEYHKDAKPIETKSADQPTVDLAGTWNITIQAGETPLPATLELQQQGTQLSGRLLSGQGNGAVGNSQLTAKDFQFDIAIGAGERSLTLKFRGERSGDELKGTLKSPFGPATAWTATRQIATVPPPKNVELSLDASEDKPVSAIATQPTSPLANAWPLEFPEDRIPKKRPATASVLIRGGTILTGTGKTLEHHCLLVRDGIIAAIEPEIASIDGVPEIDATSRFVMPGIIDTHSHIMISTGLGSVNEATDSIVCDVRVGDTINTQDVREYRALAGGVTTIRLLHGSANVIGGQDAVLQLRHGGSAAEHLFPGAHSGVKFALGENVKFRQGRFPNTRLGVEATLQRAFVEALEYRRAWLEHAQAVKAGGDGARLLPPRRDLRLEALSEILGGEKFIHSHCYRSDEILMLLRIAQQHGIRIWSLQHVLEGYKVAPEIVAHGASCSTFADWWAYKVEAYDATPLNAALLFEAGANVVLKSDDEELIRHLNQEAAKPVRYGNLPPESALSLVTLNSARELGLDDRIGSLEVGKQADIAIFNAHPLNTFARCEMTLIAGVTYFDREERPSAMSTEAAKRSATHPPLTLHPASSRRSWVDWSAVTGNSFALVGGRVVPVDQPEIPVGTVLVERGKIVSVAAGTSVPDGVPAISVEGLSVYPGLIDAGTTIGITEIGKVVETHDFAETGGFQPDLRAGVAINPDSELIPVARAGGITTALIRPTSGVISGQASIMQTAGWTAPEMVINDAYGLQINWPGFKNQPEQVGRLRDWFRAARIYDESRGKSPDAGGLDRLIDPRYEAMRPYIRRERPVLIEANSRQHIVEALKFGELEQVKVVICGGASAWQVTDELKRREVPVIVGPVMREPVDEHDPFDAPYANPGRLHDAGVKFCIRSNNPANSRNAPFEAGMAVAYGLPEEAALKAVTLSSAEILGVASECGSITPGKRANLIVIDGSPLQVTSQIKGVIVDGQPYRPESRQTRLYEKYRQRLKPAARGGNNVARP